MTDHLNLSSKFDASAKSYDAEFTHSNIGKSQRDRVYYWLDHIDFFKSPKKIFEINCGTGFDAEQFYQKGHKVLATDASPLMVKYGQQTRNKNISFQIQPFNKVAKNPELTNYDTLFSNFGGLNCIDHQELTSFFSGVSCFQKKGSQLILVMMSKRCWLESLYFLLKLQFNKVNRRNTNKGIAVNVNNESVNTYYYTPQEIKKMLNGEYHITLTKPIAFFLPPSYMEPFFQKHPYILSFLNKLEVIFSQFDFMAKWSDHYIIVAEKR